MPDPVVRYFYCKSAEWASKIRKKKVARTATTTMLSRIMKLWNRKFRHFFHCALWWSPTAFVPLSLPIFVSLLRCGPKPSSEWADSIYYFSALCGFAIVLINYAPRTMGKFIGCSMGRRPVLWLDLALRSPMWVLADKPPLHGHN